MRTIRIVILFAVCIATTSNALGAWGRAVWVHPSKNEDDFKRDYKMCEDRAAANAAHWGMAGNIFSIASDTGKCLGGERMAEGQQGSARETAEDARVGVEVRHGDRRSHSRAAVGRVSAKRGVERRILRRRAGGLVGEDRSARSRRARAE
ncbi:MAG TPA: hypothetical protein VJZ00_13010 [Thermoanaerobaculia bacterium]|nr:hypothetical protein [Thermoanaerobaculia bacterium]